MRLLILLSLVCSAWSLRGVRRMLIDPPITKVAYPEQWFKQKLDHFDILGTPSWDQRFWANLDHYVEGGPALIMIGGEGEASPGWLNFGVWLDIAVQNNAAMFLLEHRYYGQSKPTEDMSTENMKYLSSRQALEDLASFITETSQSYNITGPWVSFGGSYPGSLSAWLRLKYPHLLAGAVSSSGPLNAKMDFYEYLDVVTAALETTGTGCVETIAVAMAEVEELLEDPLFWPQLSTLFRTCKDLDGSNRADVQSFVEYLIDNLAGIVQYNGRFDLDIFDVCDIMRDQSLGPPIKRFAELNARNLEMNGEECMDHEFDSFLSLLTNTDWNGGGVGWRQWIWQTCTEFGWYQTTNQPDQVYGRQLDLDFFKLWCRSAFGEENFPDAQFEQEMIDTNAEYGGFTPAVENVVFVHGSIDPWHAMGVLESLSPKAPAIYIPGTSHCADMYSDDVNDSNELLTARATIKNLVRQWLNSN